MTSWKSGTIRRVHDLLDFGLSNVAPTNHLSRQMIMLSSAAYFLESLSYIYNRCLALDACT